MKQYNGYSRKLALEGVIWKMSLSLSHVMSFPSSKLFKHL